MFVFDSKRTHSFAGPDGTRLSLELPGSWSSVAGAPICLQDTVDGGSLQITPIPPPSSENFQHNMRKFIQPSVDHALLSSVEGSTITSAQLTYGMAEGEMDGVIAGLTTTLVQGGNPAMYVCRGG